LQTHKGKPKRDSRVGENVKLYLEKNNIKKENKVPIFILGRNEGTLAARIKRKGVKAGNEGEVPVLTASGILNKG